MPDLFDQEPTWVRINFSERFRDRMLEEPSPSKRQTARYRKMAAVGDCFEAFGATFTVTGVYKRPLWTIASSYSVEGFDSIADFKDFWGKLHPKRGFQPLDKVWVHTFRRNG